MTKHFYCVGVFVCVFVCACAQIPTVSRNGHTFQLTSYRTPTNCDHCSRPLWGVVYHGYQCSICESSVHRYCCLSELSECSGQAKASHSKQARGGHLRKLSTNRKQNITGTCMYVCYK